MSELAITIRALDIPAADGRSLGMQRGKETVDLQPSTVSPQTWSFTVAARRREDGLIDITGQWVHGKNGDRFFYLVWHDQSGERGGRSKVLFRDIDPDLVWSAFERHATLCADIHLTNARGEPAMGSVRPPQVSWRLEGGRVSDLP